MSRFVLRTLAISLFSIIVTVSPPLSAIPNTVSYQGRLTDSGGQPLNGISAVTFTIYPDSLSAFPVWQETQQVTCTDGLFSVSLGSITPMPATWYSMYTYFLGIKVGSDPELVPRRRLASTFFALRVQSIDNATGGWINGTVHIANESAGQTGASITGGRTGGYFAAYESNYASAAVKGVFSNLSSPVDAAGVEGESVTGDGWGVGGRFTGGYFGVSATTNIPSFSTGTHEGVRATAHGYAGTGINVGVEGSAGGGLYNFGVRGYGYHNGTPGAYAYGVYGSATFLDGYGAWAGYFDGWTTCKGTLEVQGTLTKTAGSFRIDHPLDPEHKYLQHSFVESPDMKNIYDGNIVTDQNGDATITMPDWFDALNRDFRYQLTVIGQFAQAIVSQELVDGRFTIKTDKPNVKVSWQVTGIRQDAYANAHRIEVEVPKKPQEVGRYIDPLAFGKPAELQLHYVMNKAAEDQRKASEVRDAKNRSEK